MTLYNTLGMTTFADYMDGVLYGPEGYYFSGTAKSGRGGDYFTAPDVGPAFGGLLAEIFRDWQKQLRADAFMVMEAGAGEGRLAQDILDTHPFRYRVVERSLRRREALKKLAAVEIFSDLDSVPPMEGVLFGNELIDAFPVHRVRMKNGKLEEGYVGVPPAFQWGPPSTPRLQSYFDRLEIVLPEDYETEVNLAMADWLTEAARVFQKGLVVLIDYGRPAHEYYAPERTGGTLRCFSNHQVIDPFSLSSSPAATSLDWTSDVDFTSLALDAKSAGFVPLAYMEMGTFLVMGLDNATRDEGRETRNRRVSTLPSSLFSRPSALKYLLHPEGMGAAFHVLILGKNIDPVEWTFAHNRLRRLGLPA